MSNKYMKKGSTSLAIEEMQIKTSLQSEWLTSITQQELAEDVGKKEHFYTVGGNAN
jgi:hypothetical protein